MNLQDTWYFVTNPLHNDGFVTTNLHFAEMYIELNPYSYCTEV